MIYLHYLLCRENNDERRYVYAGILELNREAVNKKMRRDVYTVVNSLNYHLLELNFQLQCSG